MNASHREQIERFDEHKAEGQAVAAAQAAKLVAPADPLEAFAFWIHVAEIASGNAWEGLRQSREDAEEPPWTAVGVVLDTTGESARQRANYQWSKLSDE